MIELHGGANGVPKQNTGKDIHRKSHGERTAEGDSLTPMMTAGGHPFPNNQQSPAGVDISRMGLENVVRIIMTSRLRAGSGGPDAGSVMSILPVNNI